MIDKQYDKLINYIFIVTLILFISSITYEIITHPNSINNKTNNLTINNDDLTTSEASEFNKNNIQTSQVNKHKSTKDNDNQALTTGLGSALLIYTTLSAF